MMKSWSVLLLVSVLMFTAQVQGQKPKRSKAEDGERSLQVFHKWSSVVEVEAADQSRLRFLSSLVARRSDVPVASGRQVTLSPTYIVRAQMGTPPTSLLMAMDTSYDAALVPCAANTSSTLSSLPCDSPLCRQATPSCQGPSCSFNVTYAASTFSANLSQDVLTLARDPIPAYTFACVPKTAAPAQGVLGLGRGPLSLLSQTVNLYQSTFSYCLPSVKSPNFTGSLRLGPVAQPKRIKYTPILKNPRRPSLYYVNLVGVKVGSRVVDIPPQSLAFDPATGAGTVIDSGTVFTRLVTPAYTAVRDEFRRRMKNLTVTSLGGFDTCYQEAIVPPTITLMFSGMNVTLPVDNILIHSTAGTTTCLAMAPSTALNVIASMHQQNHRILFDLPNSRLGVSRETCT